MATTASRIFVGTLDSSKVGAQVVLAVGGRTAGTFQYTPNGTFTVGSWVCTIKRGIGSGTPQDFPTVLTFSSANITQPATDAADLSGTDTIVFANSAAGTGLVDIWALLKGDV